MKIVLDAMGGDNAPQEIVKGAINSLPEKNDLEIVLVGKEELINKELSNYSFDKNRIVVINADSVIDNNESPTMAIKTKKDSSLVKSFDYLNENSDAQAIVSAGSTGAVLVGAFMKAGRIKGVSRPALAPVLPTVKGNGVILCDCGANVDCKPLNFLHFAIMASSYAKAMLKTEKPRVGLLNNGVEEHKGNETTLEAYKLLKESNLINFVGNCEARDILTGEFDVVVCDGFNGNIALKSAEGTATAMFDLIKDGIYANGLRAKLGFLLLKPVFKSVKHKMDYNANGGACFLGVNKVVVKSHGASKAKSITSSIIQAYELAKADICSTIKKDIDQVIVKEENND